MTQFNAINDTKSTLNVRTLNRNIIINAKKQSTINIHIKIKSRRKMTLYEKLVKVNMLLFIVARSLYMFNDVMSAYHIL